MKKISILLIAAVSVMLLISSCIGNNSGQSEGPGSADIEEALSLLKPIPPKRDGPVRILFVGNSHTEFFVSIPYLFDALCSENDKSVEIATLVEMGSDINEILDANKSYLDDYFSIADSDGNCFDYVILQEKTNTAVNRLNSYKKNCKKVADLVLKNSPDAAFYVYELMPPIEIADKGDFIKYKNKSLKNAIEVANILPNAGVLPIGSAVADAYDGKDGYIAMKGGKDLLRNNDLSLHMLNDAGFLASIIVYRTVYGETPTIPSTLPLATGTGDDDEIKMLDVNTTISNPEALLKIAAGY